MHECMRSIALLVLISAVTSSAVAGNLPSSTQQRDQSRCSIPAFADPDARPIAIRSTHDRHGKRVGTLPLSWSEDGQRKGAYMTIKKLESGRALISDVVSWDNITTAPSGWVEARHLRFVLQTFRGFADKDHLSPVVLTLDDWLFPRQIRQLAECDGEWVKAVVRIEGHNRTAWFRGSCANQETTCDGLVGDPLPTSSLSDAEEN